jgi:glycosyltransferase involved in cell wall biosynthesis
MHGSSQRRLVLAVFGWLERDAGSVASAHNALIEALLHQGHEIDYFAQGGFTPNPHHRGRFRFIEVHTPSARFRLPKVGFTRGSVVSRLEGRRTTSRYLRLAAEVAERQRAARSYDAWLFLGVPPGRGRHGAPRVVWAQCAPQNELQAVQALAGPIRRVSGLRAYTKLRIYYEVKDRVTWRWARRAHLILASERSRRQAVAFGVSPRNVLVVPYAVDLEKFTPGAVPSGEPRRIVCIGRLDPRKRVDLLVDAVRVLSRQRQDFQVEVIGRDGYLEGWSDWLQREMDNLPMTYTPAVPQSVVLRRLQEADVLVQPSTHEEFGHAVAEALACGVPVVVGSENGTAEWGPPEATFVFQEYSPEALADAMGRALDVARDSAVRSASRAAATAFSANRIAEDLASYIGGVADRLGDDS